MIYIMNLLLEMQINSLNLLFFLSFIQTPKKRGRKSTSRSRSRSRGRSASKGKKSPSRKKLTPVKQETAVRRSSRSRSRGRQQTTVETLTVSVTWSQIAGDRSRVTSCYYSSEPFPHPCFNGM